jgi:hypothetical protein
MARQLWVWHTGLGLESHRPMDGNEQGQGIPGPATIFMRGKGVQYYSTRTSVLRKLSNFTHGLYVNLQVLVQLSLWS